MKVGADLGVGRSPRRPDPPGARPRRDADDGCQPGLGRRRGDRGDAAARPPRSLVDRGADQPRRRARARAHPPRARADPRGDRRARAEPRRSSSSSSRRTRSTSASSTRAASAASTRRSPCCCWRRSSASRCVRTPAASGSASTCSTSRSSTTSRSAARSTTAWSSGSITCTSTSGILPSSSAAAMSRRSAPGYSIEMLPSSLDEYEFPGRAGVVAARGRGGRRMTVAARSGTARVAAGCCGLDRYRLLQASLLSLRAGPALILLLLIVVDRLTTPIFLTSRNIGNIFSQTSVIAVVALGQLLVIVTRGIDLSVGSTIALSGVVGAIVFEHTQLERPRDRRDPRHGRRGRRWSTGSSTSTAACRTPSSSRSRRSASCAGIALWASDGTLIPGMPPIVADDRRRHDRLAPVLDLRRRGRRAVRARPDDLARLGPLAVRRRRQPRGGAPVEHPDAPGARDGLRAERAGRRRRRADHRRA